MKIELSIPPTTNHLFKTVRLKTGKILRAPTEEYKAWQEVNGWQMRQHITGTRFENPVRLIVTIRGGKGFPVSSDISNRIKAVEDLLVKCGVIKDDTVEYVREVRAVYLPPISKEDKATCTVELYPVVAIFDLLPKARKAEHHGREPNPPSVDRTGA